MSNILKNVKIKRISLVRKGANGQTLQFCKSRDCIYKAATESYDNVLADGPSAEMQREIYNIMNEPDSASSMLCGIARSTMRLDPNENPHETYRRAVMDAVETHPWLFKAHLKTSLISEGAIPL